MSFKFNGENGGLTYLVSSSLTFFKEGKAIALMRDGLLKLVFLFRVQVREI